MQNRNDYLTESREIFNTVAVTVILLLRDFPFFKGQNLSHCVIPCKMAELLVGRCAANWVRAFQPGQRPAESGPRYSFPNAASEGRALECGSLLPLWLIILTQSKAQASLRTPRASPPLKNYAAKCIT